jgi:xanthine dehydrogenase iron-sulfur cluster and FAD-binding subunit A
LMTMKAFLDANPTPSAQEIRVALSGNLCRCTGYQQIVEWVTPQGYWRPKGKDARHEYAIDRSPRKAPRRP